jgi:hypothetical protein
VCEIIRTTQFHCIILNSIDEKAAKMTNEACSAACTICRLPLDAVHFIMNLVDTFGWKFVGIVFAVYGLNQGVGEGWLYVLQRYFFKDILLLSPAHAQMLTAVARTPWNVKVCKMRCIYHH